MPVGYIVQQLELQVMAKKIEFRKEMVNTKGLTLVHFKKKYNGACQIVDSIYEDLVKEYKQQADFFIVDIEKQPEIGKQYGIVEIPTILFFRGGEVVDHITGLASKNEMIDKIQNALSIK